MLKGKTILIPPLDYGFARVLAAAFRAAGFSAEALPPSDEQTRKVSERYTSGDECHSFQILAGDIMKRLESSGADPVGCAFLVPVSDGPCRVSRFIPDLREIVERSGWGRAEIIPLDRSHVGEMGGRGVRIAWRALVSADTLHKLLLFYRPFEATKGAADTMYEKSILDLCTAIESAPASDPEEMEAITSAFLAIRCRFREILVKEERPAPRIGIVGEVFCRFNPFLNSDLVRQIEGRGGQVRLADMAGEVRQYMDAVVGISEELNKDRMALVGLFHDECEDHDEPATCRLMEYARAYLPAESCFKGPALRLGQIVSMAQQGMDGIIDASPFPCMNTSVCASFYPRLSRDLDGLPIHTFYSTATRQDWSNRIDEYLGLARTYAERRTKGRI